MAPRGRGRSSRPSAPRLGRHPSARLGGGRRFALERDDEAPLQLRGQTVHKARADNRDGALVPRPRLARRRSRCSGWHRRGGRLDRGALVIVQAESGIDGVRRARRADHKPSREAAGERPRPFSALTATLLGDDVLSFMGAPRGRNMAHEFGRARRIAWPPRRRFPAPDSIRSEIARWLAPNDVGGNSPPALDTDKENNGAKDASGGNPPLKPNGRDRHPPPERVAADNSFPIASTPRRAKARRNNAKSAEQRPPSDAARQPGLERRTRWPKAASVKPADRRSASAAAAQPLGERSKGTPKPGYGGSRRR